MTSIKKNLQDTYEMSQSQVGKKLFLKQQTIQKIEKKAFESFKKELSKRDINLDDLI